VFVRGSNSGIESKREDFSMYRGIVARNDDPLQMNRVKVYIPELSNQPVENWLDTFDNMSIKIPGTNIESDNWQDLDIYQEILNNLPWAEIMYPIIGESSNARYFSNTGQSIISDSNYVDNINTKTPNLTSGTFSPAYLYDNYVTMINDAMINPIANDTVKNNPYGYSYRPNKMVNQTKGIMGIPEIGSKVWVTHYMGDLNFPLVIGVMQDHRSLRLINENVNYPRNTENKFLNE
jgi:hypothetical protein